MKKLYTIIFSIFITVNMFAQNSFEYIVQEIPYQTFQEQNIIQFNADDVYSNIITIPFSFIFFENESINEFVVGSNGTITFDVSLANNWQPWQFDPEDLVPSTDLPNPAILGSYHDLFNVVGNGGVYSGITGNTPNRKFHITFEDIPLFSCNNLLSTFQMIIHETSGIIDISITNKPVCTTWNEGLTVLGLQAEVNGELHGITAPNRNTGVWEAQEEAWRFIPTSYFNEFNVVICDIDNNSVEQFDIDEYKASLLQFFNLDSSTNTVDILDFNDTIVNGNISVSLGDNLPENSYTINFNNGAELFDLNISLLNCDNDDENDGLTNGEEDVNGNGNLADDDTDGDGIPNYLDDDDDGDTVLTNIEIVFNGGRNSDASATFLDTDNDGIPNHLDFDDDGDGVLTLDEDYNGNGDPTDDDVNNNGIADYLDANQLNVNEISLNTKLFSLYPNPVKNNLFIKFLNQSGFEGSVLTTKIYDYQGRLIIEQDSNVLDNIIELNITSLATGNYLLIVKKGNLIKAKKFIVE